MLGGNDPYGDMGAIAHAQWTAIWRRWSAQERDQYFEALRTGARSTSASANN